MDHPTAPPTDTAVEVSKDDRTIAMLAHLSGLMGGFVVPLVLWAIKKDESAFVGYHALQALIFQGTMAVAMLVVVLPLSMVTCGLGSVLVFPVLAVQIAGAVVYGLKANDGKWEGYPLIAHYGWPGSAR